MGTTPLDDPPTYLKVTSHHTNACGMPHSANNGQLQLALTGTPDPITIPLTQITNLAIVTTCN